MSGAAPDPAPRRSPEEILAAIDERLQRLEARSQHLEALLARLPGVAGAAVDALDQRLRQAQERGVDVDARLAAALRVLDTLTAPAAAEALSRAVALAQQAPAALAMLTDAVDDRVARLQGDGVSLDQRLRGVATVLSHLTAPESLALLTRIIDRAGGLAALLDSGLLAPGTLRVLGDVALAISQSGEPPRVGALGLLRALGRPEVQRALGFGVSVLQHLGAALEAHARLAPPANRQDPPAALPAGQTEQGA